MLDISEQEASWILTRYLIETDRISIKYNELFEWAKVEGLTAEIMAIGRYLGEYDMAKRGFPNGMCIIPKVRSTKVKDLGAEEFDWSLFGPLIGRLADDENSDETLGGTDGVAC